MSTSKKSTSTRMIQVDLDDLPALTEEQKKRLEALADMPDEQIDSSDAPYRPDAVWTRPLPFSSRNKRQISLRIDADVLDYFQDTGRRYQTRINAVLRTYVEAAKAGRSGEALQNLLRQAG